jgi:hypothetical protein
MEIREALELDKPILLIHEADNRFGTFDFGSEGAAAPEDLREVLYSHESMPFRRRGYERDSMLQTLLERAGFKDLLAGRETKAESGGGGQLAKVPHEIQHFSLESFHDRPVQGELVELLLLPKVHKKFTNCLLIHGMGGTGKTVTVVAVVQETAVRQHFTHIFFLALGQNAVGSKIRQLQSMLYKQMTGKSVNAEEAREKDERDFLDMLVGALTMRRALVILDDPWLVEQVRYLNPIRESGTEHRLLVTSRIKTLVPKALCIELALMGKDDAVGLLLDLANIQKDEYTEQHPGTVWPPPSAYEIATECGLLPMTMSIAAQVMRSWGAGWEEAVLPLLIEQQQQKDGVASTVEGRIIGAGTRPYTRPTLFPYRPTLFPPANSCSIVQG